MSLLRNLISNALKYSAKDDRITVAVSKKGKRVEFSVSDTGIGMNGGQVQMLLDVDTESMSRKGTKNEEGTGIGFAISKGFVNRNGGKIAIESSPGKGSCFRFTLPIAAVAKDAPAG